MRPALRRSAHPPATFAEPTPFGHLYLGFEVDVPAHVPFVRRSRRRAAALERITALARELATDPGSGGAISSSGSVPTSSWPPATPGGSAILQPVGDGPYAFVDHVRLPHGALRFVLAQLVRPSFLTFVRANLRDTGMVAMPAFYRPVDR